jgi:hypothetical protein
MGLVIAGHTDTPPTIGWVRGELGRVLDKLQPDQVTVRFDVGTALDATEIAVVGEFDVWIDPIVELDRLIAYAKGYPGTSERIRTIRRNACLSILPAHAESISRGTRRAHAEALRDTGQPHLLIYDGRPRGSVFQQMNDLLGTHDLYILDPVRQRTVHLPALEA